VKQARPVWRFPWRVGALAREPYVPHLRFGPCATCWPRAVVLLQASQLNSMHAVSTEIGRARGFADHVGRRQ